MDWIQVKIVTKKDGIEPVLGLLYDLGISGTEISDKDDFKEFLENNRKYWDYVDEELEKLKTADTMITLYLSNDKEGEDTLSLIKREIKSLKETDKEDLFGTLEIITKSVKDEDWSENWKQYFKPLKIGEKVLIVPEWEEIPETDRTVFIINPGMSFGTGSHESTQMCIEEAEKIISSGTTVLDLGCGSGILSVISLLLGAKKVSAVDIDAMAVEVSYENLKLNGIEREKLSAFQSDVTVDEEMRKKFKEEKSDLVFANIVADVIIPLSSFVGDFMTDDGYFICSGVIKERTEEVKNTLIQNGFELVKLRQKGEWSAFVMKKAKV